MMRRNIKGGAGAHMRAAFTRDSPYGWIIMDGSFEREEALNVVLTNPSEVTPMNKTLTALAAAATFTAAAVATPTAADARRGWWGPAIVGGFAAAAIVGAFARPYYYPYSYGYYPGPVVYDYYVPAYAPAPYYYAYPPGPYYSCVRWQAGYRMRVC
jgi:hypothetical protein